MKNEILITCDAVKTIIRDSRKHSVETGGILVGSFEGPIVIVAAGESGVNSVHHAVQYTSDATQDKKCLAEARRQFDGKPVVVGWWHQHPGGYDRPSGGDCIQAQKLAGEYNDGKPILMAIVNRYGSNGRSKTSLKFYSLNQSGKLVGYAWKIVPSTDKNILAAINAMPGRPEIGNAEFWCDENFQFYMNSVGRKRISTEIQQLKNAGWNVVTSREKNSGILTMDISAGRMGISLKFPPEYPLNPPTVFVSGRAVTSLGILGRWNSLRTILEITNEIKELINE